jgi:RNA polymerase sigma factor (sigma-70 family)
VSLTDSDLIARALGNGDEQAFAELVRRYQSSVRAFARSLTRGDAHLADDVAQETFLKAWLKLGAYRGDARFSAWLFSIAYHEFCRLTRKRGPLPPDEILIEEAASEPGGEDARIDLPSALNRLSEGERAAIVLCYQNGLSNEDAAHVLNCPLGTVKTNILRGKEKLRKLLHEYQVAKPA